MTRPTLFLSASALVNFVAASAHTLLMAYLPLAGNGLFMFPGDWHSHFVNTILWLLGAAAVICLTLIFPARKEARGIDAAQAGKTLAEAAGRTAASTSLGRLYIFSGILLTMFHFSAQGAGMTVSLVAAILGLVTLSSALKWLRQLLVLLREKP